MWTAANSLAAGFFVATVDKTRPFTALALAIGTVIVGRTLSGLRTSRYFVRRVRTFLSDFGPIISVVSMSAIAAIPAVAKIGLPALSIPKTFSLAHGRPLFIPLMATPMHIRLAAIVPALLLTCLFYLDQNISVRVVNAPHRKLRKGPGYHLDMFMLAVCTFLSAICAMPMMCAGTVQSLAHVQALTNVESVDGKDRIVSVVENRLTPFLIHALIFGSLLLLPVVSRIPMAVIAGLFLYLGRNMMAPSQNDFLGRIRYLFMDPKLYPEDSPMKKDNVPARQVNAFTILQLACLSLLWVLKLNKATAMYFPCVIGVLMIIRSKIAPHFFPKETLAALDAEIGKAEEGEPASKQGTASLSTQ